MESGNQNQVKILIVENGLNDLIKSRIPFGQYCELNGFKVLYACPEKHKGVIELAMQRDTLKLFQLLRSLRTLIMTERDREISITLSFRLVPNILNFLASIFNPKVKRTLVITGLGRIIVSNKITDIIRLKIIYLFYHVAKTHCKVVSQNIDDLIKLKLVKRGFVIDGSGISGEVVHIPRNFQKIKLLFVGRLLHSKGVMKLQELAVELAMRNLNFEISIVGSRDLNNLDSISEFELSKITHTPNVSYFGQVQDVEPYYRSNDVFLYFSEYGEGIPRVLIEALRFGLTIITLDRPGCKETISNNGLLLPSYNSDKIIKYLSALSSEKLEYNSTNSHLTFTERFSTKIVYPKLLNLISLSTTKLA